jgi:tellurite resistance protein
MNRIKNFPISFFTITMGLSGLSVSISMAKNVIIIPNFIFLFSLSLSIVSFIIILFFYILKIFNFYNLTKNELEHPIQSSFFPSFSISLLLIALALNQITPLISYYTWLLGMILQLFFTLIIINNWIQKNNFQIENLSPAWFIPVVGNIIIPILGVNYMHPDINWFIFGLGLSIWLFLMSIFFYRIIFYQPLPQKLLPTLFILIAPPAIAFISYYKISGFIDGFAQSLYGLSLFFFILLLYQINNFRSLKFYLSWWAYSFPLAALSIASIINYNNNHLPLYRYLYLGIFSLLTILIVFLIFHTIRAIYKKSICQIEP